MLVPIHIVGSFLINTDQIKLVTCEDKDVKIFVKNKNEAFLIFNFSSEEVAQENLELIKSQFKID